MRRSRSLAALVVLIAAAVLVWSGGTAGQSGLRTTTVLQTSTTAHGQLLQFPLFRNQFTGVLFELAPGGRVGRHRHPVPNVVYVIEGELTVEADGQPMRVYRAGQAFSEGDQWHDGINSGAVPMRAWVVFAGAEGQPVTVRP
ncbi:MAG TPA: cupin domain-containing protein [bacterium]|nr:cupin domain-containing protein [bacterium]